ncbi:Bcr/CflA family efflux MFS transporter [Streptomyces sp. TRM70308]|uniref:multidrug effflux MFS transporter n=1 Tax=Streptomyces sp. TRM70308 TaxID=3131932 RepID=UPI003D056D43
MSDSGPSSCSSAPSVPSTPSPRSARAARSAPTADDPLLPGPRGPVEAPASEAVVTSSAAPPAAPELTRRQRAGLLLTLVLGSLTALPPLSMDMYLPALPEVGAAFGSPAAQVQLTLTTCLLGLALGQVVVGPMSDRFGRRRPLLAGMVCYVAASAACAFAPTVEALTAFRLLQGLAGAAAIVIARAVVRDLFDGLAMARFFSTLLLVSGAAPVLAPVLGAQVMHFTDWRGIFLILAGLGVVLTLVTVRWLPETLPPAARHGGGLRQALRTMRTLLADRVFSGYLLTGSLAFAALFAYIAASPFVVQEIYGASPQTFSLLFMVNSVGLVAVGQLNGKVLVGRVRLDRVLLVGLGVTTVAAVVLLLLTAGVFGEVGLAPIAGGLFVLMSGMALVLPNANSQGLQRAPHAAGSASALLGTSQFLIGAVASPLVGVAGEHTAVPMALVQLATLVLAGGCFVGMCRPWRHAA